MSIYDITPGRSTQITFDLDETVLSEPDMTVVRRGADVARLSVERIADPSNYAGLKFYSSGCWALRPVQEDITNISQYAEGYVHILGPGEFTLLQYQTATGIIAILNSTVPQWARAVTLGGFGYTGSIADSGDAFMIPQWPASVTSHDPADVSANSALLTSDNPQVPLPNADIPVDRVAISNDSYPADQAWFLRWNAPGSSTTHSRYVFAFTFGQYTVVIEGDGKAQLWENCKDADGDYHWAQRGAWNYARKAQVYNVEHTLAIYPHTSHRGDNLIAFGNNQLDAAAVISTVDRSDSRDVSADTFVYRASEAIRGTDQDESPGHATKAGKIAFDIARDLRLKFQVSKLAFATSGTLIDNPANVGGGLTTANTNAVSVTMDAVIPPGCTLTATVKDAQTNAAFVPGTDSQPFCTFSFTGDGTQTPVLFGYKMEQAAMTADISPGSFTALASDYSLTGYSGDPSQVSASATVKDIGNAYPRLRSRGGLSCKIVINDPSLGTESHPELADVTVFRGYATRPRSIRRGVDTGTGFPASDWREYSLSMVGMWARLAERVTGPVMMAYGSDPAAMPDPVTGVLPPWKVTDAIVDLIRKAGFPDSQIAIPSLSYRLWPAQTGKVDDYQVGPGTNYADQIARMVKSYLGCYLDYNEHIGSDGAWTLLFGAVPGDGGAFTPVYNFVSDFPDGTLPHVAGSYPANTTFISGRPDFVVVPPEFNMVKVSTDTALTGVNTRIANVAFCSNYSSYAVPGASVAPDPSNPDYIGRCRPLIVLDPSLGGDTAADTWKSVSWTCRRLFDAECHAQVTMHYTAPFVFFMDADLGKYRPLRFQDPISIDSDPTWVVRSVRPSHTVDSMQMASYEVVQPLPGQYVRPGMDELHTERQAARRVSLQASGSHTYSNLFGLQGVPAHREHSHLSLPVYTPTQARLQDDAGAWVGDWSDYENATRGV